jgi:hypothetical protein
VKTCNYEISGRLCVDVTWRVGTIDLLKLKTYVLESAHVVVKRGS